MALAQLQQQSSSSTAPRARGVPVNPVVEKLGLVLDVDNTLVHTVKKSTFHHALLDIIGLLDEHGERIFYEWTPLDSNAEPCYVKLRPGLRSFLAELQQFFDLSIFSAGTRE